MNRGADVKRTFTLAHAQARANAIEYVRTAPDGYTVEVAPPKRTSPENRLLHALIGQIAGRVEWCGAKRDSETWKRLLVSSWCRATGEPVEILASLDGMGVDIVPRRTSKLTKKECADLIEFVQAWAATHDVHLDAGPQG